MHLRRKMLHLFTFLILLVWVVDASIEIFDAFGRKVDRFFDREAPLDDDIPEWEGFIALTDPSDACSIVAEPTFLTNFSYYKFALINGSETCGYKHKIHMAGSAGYDFAIIFDPKTGPLQYLGFGFEPHIPTVLISYDDGLTIKDNYVFNTSSNLNYRISVKQNIPDFSYYMYLFVAIIGICFFVMILFMMCLLIKCIQERRKSKRNRLSSRQIKQIPTAKFSKGDQYDVCAICLEDYNEGDKLRILPCSHAYHAKCIDPWLMNNRRNCPLCKRKITFGDSADESDSEDSELTSPAENTPLLRSPTWVNEARTWGTFQNTGQPSSSHDTGGPSSMPDSYSDVNTDPRHSTATFPSHAENCVVSDSESECLLPPPLYSVNSGRPEKSSDQDEVQVNFVNPFEGETSSNHAASI